MIDVKKFVVVFLIFAAVASGSALFFLNSQSASPSASNAQSFTVQTSGNEAPSLGNVFATSQSDEVGADDTVDASGTSISSDPDNLTDQLASSFVNQLVAANPDGLQDDGDGNDTVAVPATQNVLSELATSSALASMNIPNWDVDVAEVPVNVATSTSDAAVSAYSNDLSNIINNDFVTTNLQSIMGDTSDADPSQLSFAASEIGDAINSVSGLTAPSNLAAFHQSLIKLLVYEKDALALGQNTGDDPVMTSLIFQAENDKYEAATQAFEDQFEQATKDTAFSFASDEVPVKQNAAVAFVNNLLGIQEAHAQFGGIVFDPTLFARVVWQFVQGMLLQILKNTVITLIQNKVLAMIKNNGNPRFVQSWSGLVSTAFNGAVGAALGQISPGLCPNFNTNVMGWLQNSFTGVTVTTGGFTLNGAASTNCNLQAAVPNVGAYYGNFNTNGFNGFANLLSPNNNPFGAFAQSYDQLQILGGSAQTAATNNAIAGQGSSGQGLCDDGSTPNPGDGNLCDDGSEALKVTPGSSFIGTLNRNLNSNIDLIVNANDITGLLATITSALLQQVINAGVKGLLGSVTAGTGAPATPAPPATPLVCNAPAATGIANSTIYFTVTGGTSGNYTWNAPGGNPAAGTSPVFTTLFAAPGTYTVTVTNIGTVNTTVSCPAVTIN